LRTEEAQIATFITASRWNILFTNQLTIPGGHMIVPRYKEPKHVGCVWDCDQCFAALK
jgi:hypothetical protein